MSSVSERLVFPPPKLSSFSTSISSYSFQYFKEKTSFLLPVLREKDNLVGVCIIILIEKENGKGFLEYHEFQVDLKGEKFKTRT